MHLFRELKKSKGTRAIALVGVMAATLSCGKLVLSFLPNIEIVTLLCALYGYIFGWLGVAAALVFVCVEPMIYGFGSWLLTYILYWPLVAFIFMILKRKGIGGRVIPTLVAVCLTVFFGMLSSVIDSAFYLGINENYLSNLVIYYIRGVVFYIVQTACNLALFVTIFPYLSKKIPQIIGGI